ncbi:hypothetical protein JWG42_09085 [Desulfoprunum benzoelyticum]|uniref:Uncharacterized membrane protein (DUF485 family) n=1 Tax=Desulfoprunum benzoelyticum TaxID=1506996 RepID=A0A840V2I6_9BACT|nr:hypothetical protein [Desulfoprunum benzoelyticum]MBB5347939.1 uncharacterized membrane protein (DUF485 family) [Desulfoprunum benzoelyticum]MBM9530305.1 hypothetical protein [Desulfoprunum benzoelyticum]
MTNNWLLLDSRLPLEVVILLICSMSMLILGALLFPVHAGILPYYEGGLFGLLLFVFALQTITLGKTPFGDTARSWLVIAAGTVIAVIGIVACFIPDAMGRVPRMLLISFFGIGGMSLLLQLFLSKSKFRIWRRYGGIFHHLTIACALVYLFSIVMAVFLSNTEFATTPQIASAALIFGLAILYLAWVLQKIYSNQPSQGALPCRTKGGLLAPADLSIDNILLLVLGLFILILGILLIPVNLGMLPFSGSAQLGLMMVIFSVQMIALGNTPIGPFRRSRLIVITGLVFAALGITSCIIPEILVPSLTMLIGFLNLIGGIAAIVKIVTPALKVPQSQSAPDKTQTQITMATLTMNILTIAFGASMLIPNIIPGLILGAVLTADGCVLLFLVSLLVKIEQGFRGQFFPRHCEK